MEGDPRLLHVHRVRALLGQLPGAPHGQDPQPQAPDARSPRSPLRARRRVHRDRATARRTARPKAAADGAVVERRPRTVTAPEGAAPPDERSANGADAGINLVPDVIHPDVLWACTTCRACEEQCPVLISYVDKIVDMRRNLVMVKGEFPHELAKPFQGMEANGNPWNLSRMDRVGVGRRTRRPDDGREARRRRCSSGSAARRATTTARRRSRARRRGCSSRRASTSPSSGRKRAARATRRAARATSFSSRCSPRATRRTLNGYKEQGGVRTVVTTCPHCFNSLKNEYPDFGAQGRSRPPHRLPARPRGRGQARADEARRGARRLPRLAATSAATTACTTRRARS